MSHSKELKLVVRAEAVNKFSTVAPPSPIAETSSLEATYYVLADVHNMHEICTAYYAEIADRRRRAARIIVNELSESSKRFGTMDDD